MFCTIHGVRISGTPVSLNLNSNSLNSATRNGIHTLNSTETASKQLRDGGLATP